MPVKEIEVDILPGGRMTTESCAAYTGFSVSSLVHFRAEGKGPLFVRIEGKVFYLKKDVDAWLKRK